MGAASPTMRGISRLIHTGTDAGITPFADHVPSQRLLLWPNPDRELRTMWHFHSDIIHAASGRASDGGRANRQSGETIAPPVHKKPCLLSKVVLAGFILASSVGIADASGRTTILGYICATYESARQVALEHDWERPKNMPGDCRNLSRQGLEGRFAEISEIIEVLPIGDGRWVEIGKVRRQGVQTGYSAGISEQLLLF